MDRKPVGGIVNRQRDSSSFLSIFFPRTKGFWEEERPLIEHLFFFTANCGYTSIKVSVFQTTKTVFEKERSMLTFGKKKQRPYRWRVRWFDGGKGLTVFLDFSLSTINDRVNLSLLFSFSVLPFCNVCLSKLYFGFLCFFLIASFSISLHVPGFSVSLGFF